MQPHGAQPDMAEGGPLQARLEGMAVAAEQMAGSLRARLAPDDVALEFGVKVSGELTWWFFAKNQAEGTIEVTLKWGPPPGSAVALK